MDTTIREINHELANKQEQIQFMSAYFPFMGGETYYVKGGQGTLAREIALNSLHLLKIGQLARRNSNVLIISNPNKSIEDGFYTDWAIHDQSGKVIISGVCDYETTIGRRVNNFYGVDVATH
jgi:hypothetical protein